MSFDIPQDKKEGEGSMREVMLENRLKSISGLVEEIRGINPDNIKDEYSEEFMAKLQEAAAVLLEAQRIPQR